MKARICTPAPVLTETEAILAAQRAIEEFPANAPLGETNPLRIAVVASKWWGARSTDLTVGFMEGTSEAMRNRVLAFANSWGEFANVRFRWSQTDPIIRISFGRGGYWSYLGTDCLGIPKNRQTMNLEGFTLRTAEREWNRVVKHEFGHSLGCPHEHARREIVALLDERKVIDYFARTQGWSEQDIRQQILTPLEERSLMQGTSPQADILSVMTYQFPGQVTRSGQPIPGGLDFSVIDRQYMGRMYPKSDQPPPPPPGGQIVILVGLDAAGKEVARFKL